MEMSEFTDNQEVFVLNFPPLWSHDKYVYTDCIKRGVLKYQDDDMFVIDVEGKIYNFEWDSEFMYSTEIEATKALGEKIDYAIWQANNFIEHLEYFKERSEYILQLQKK